SACSPVRETSHLPDVAALAAPRAHREFVRSINDAARKRGASADLQASFNSSNAKARFTAIYLATLWAATAPDAAVRRPLLGDPDDGIRAMVAGSLSGLGDAGAMRVLEALSTSTALMPY